MNGNLRNIVLTVLLFISSLLLLTCNRPSTGPGGALTILPGMYPLQVGHQWRYNFVYVNSIYDTIHNRYSVINDNWGQIRVAVETVNSLRDTLQHTNIACYRMANYLVLNYYDSNQTTQTIYDTAAVWYANKTDGLYAIAYSYGTTFQPKRNSLIQNLNMPFAFPLLNINSSNSLRPNYYYFPPNLLLPYPPTIGRRWISYNHGTPDTSSYEISGNPTVISAGATFSCLEVKIHDVYNATHYPDKYFTDEIASVGLIKRQVYMPYLKVTGTYIATEYPQILQFP